MAASPSTEPIITHPLLAMAAPQHHHLHPPSSIPISRPPPLNRSRPHLGSPPGKHQDAAAPPRSLLPQTFIHARQYLIPNLPSQATSHQQIFINPSLSSFIGLPHPRTNATSPRDASTCRLICKPRTIIDGFRTTCRSCGLSQTRPLPSSDPLDNPATNTSNASNALPPCFILPLLKCMPPLSSIIQPAPPSQSPLGLHLLTCRRSASPPSLLSMHRPTPCFFFFNACTLNPLFCAASRARVSLLCAAKPSTSCNRPPCPKLQAMTISGRALLAFPSLHFCPQTRLPPSRSQAPLARVPQWPRPPHAPADFAP